MCVAIFVTLLQFSWKKRLILPWMKEMNYTSAATYDQFNYNEKICAQYW